MWTCLFRTSLASSESDQGYESYEMNHHRFHIEESPKGTLTVTPYFSRVQPVIRLDTGIPTSVLH